MPLRIGLILALLALCGCKPTEDSHMKAIIGAVLMDGAGGPPVTNSVVVIAGDRIQAAGASSTVPIPALADKIDGSGRFLVPAPVDMFDGAHRTNAAAVHLFSTDEPEIEKARDFKYAILRPLSTP